MIYRVGFLPWQKLFLPDNGKTGENGGKNRQKLWCSYFILLISYYFQYRIYWLLHHIGDSI